MTYRRDPFTHVSHPQDSGEGTSISESDDAGYNASLSSECSFTNVSDLLCIASYFFAFYLMRCAIALNWLL